MAAIPVRKFPFICKVVLFYGNSFKSCSIHHWKFPEAQTHFFNEWKVPTKCKTQKSGNLLHRTLFTTFNKFNKSAHVK